MTRRLHKNEVCHENLIVWFNGFQNNTKNIDLEIILFPFLFPHGNGAYDGKITIHKCFKFQMSSLFSSFTLYKPYLLIMYDFQQSLQFIKHTSNSCLEKDIQIIKTKTCRIDLCWNFGTYSKIQTSINSRFSYMA